MTQPQPPTHAMVHSGGHQSPLPTQTFGEVLQQALGQFRGATRGQRVAVVSGSVAVIAIFVMILVILARK